MLERAKFDGAPVSADICAHQVFLSEREIKHFDGNYHVIPPLRSRVDVAGLRQKLSSDIIHAIFSDHQPHEPDAKLAPFPSTEPGISALETLLPLAMKLVEEEVASLSEIISLLTSKPAKLLNINAGSLAPGCPADLCFYNPAIEWTLTSESINSRGKNTPFTGSNFKGKVTHTLVNGKVAYQN